MLIFKGTERISKGIQDSLDKCAHPSVVESFSKYIIDSSTDLETVQVPFSSLKQLLEINPDLDLFQLLQGSQIILDKPPVPVKSQKLLDILKECQDIVDKKEYYRMTKGLDGKKDVNMRFKDLKFTIGQVSSIFNVLLSMASVFTVVMYFGDQIGSLPIKVLAALISAWIVGKFKIKNLNCPENKKMSSMRDAMRRLQIIYDNCVPEAIEAKAVEAKMDEFTRLRKRIHADVKAAREAIKDRDILVGRGETTAQSAEASYRIRVAIKSIKELVSKMQEIHNKEVRKAKSKDSELINDHKEVLELCQLHIAEIEKLEKARGNEGYQTDRDLLISGNHDHFQFDPNKPDMQTDDNILPDIYIEEDLKRINANNKAIEDDIYVIGEGVSKLKEIALDMNQELDKQQETLANVDQKANDVLDHVDNINVSMKKALDGFMPADNFMVNCVLMCIILAFAGYLSSLFT